MMSSEQHTEHLASTFSYSEAEVRQILAGITLDNETDLMVTSNQDGKRILLNLQKKELNSSTHITSLARYLRAKKIPRGLRVELKPNLCDDDPILQQRWEEICNKCSVDLMALTIERLKVKVQPVRAEIEKMKVELKMAETEEVARGIFSEHAEVLDRLHKAITERKSAKFERDTEDYLHNRVYTWREEQHKQRWEQTEQRTVLNAPWRSKPRNTGRQAPPFHYAPYNQGRQYHASPDYPQYYPRERRDYQFDDRRRDSSSDSRTASTSYSFLESSQESVGAGREGGFPPDGNKARKKPRAPLPRENYPQRTRQQRR
ncbi:hypothetical protein XELAEV_18029716mg [Xenopus laevis]|uniref:Uncharacterized protein n=1 Tax=Xenopus laevis TaxID=8355 RepID=A0A974CSM2_XENLA|nr:hypothetical protein XELAEV_18029716mg [Xenopus laevis]